MRIEILLLVWVYKGLFSPNHFKSKLPAMVAIAHNFLICICYKQGHSKRKNKIQEINPDTLHCSNSPTLLKFAVVPVMSFTTTTTKIQSLITQCIQSSGLFSLFQSETIPSPPCLSGCSHSRRLQAGRFVAHLSVWVWLKTVSSGSVRLCTFGRSITEAMLSFLTSIFNLSYYR